MENNRSFAVIILNYMSYSDTISEIIQLKKLRGIENCKIYIVDNASENDSYAELKIFIEKEKKLACELISNSINGGYAKGNNIGLKKSFHDGFSRALVLNNDILFSDINLIYKLSDVMDADSNIGCCSPRVFSLNGKEMHQHLFRPSYIDCSFGRVLFRLRENCYEAKNKNKTGYVLNYRPQGCCMAIDLNKLEKVGYLDEDTFLYYEETLLAERFNMQGWYSALALDTSIIHNHSKTVKSVAKKKQIINWVLDSAQIYYKKYRQFREWQVKTCLFSEYIKEKYFV